MSPWPSRPSPTGNSAPGSFNQSWRRSCVLLRDDASANRRRRRRCGSNPVGPPPPVRSSCCRTSACGARLLGQGRVPAISAAITQSIDELSIFSPRTALRGIRFSAAIGFRDLVPRWVVVHLMARTTVAITATSSRLDTKFP